MKKINSMLTERLRQATAKFSKMTSLAEMSSSGNLSSFSGVFRVVPLSEKEKETLQVLLSEYKNEEQEIGEDLKFLSSITSEVKAINNQAAILHGERIKKAQEILKKYRDGAFSAWLLSTYGNRQTPYNFLQYHELYLALPQSLHPKLDEMPRQAVYTLASRTAPLKEKEEIIKNYQGEPKNQVLSQIRKAFPLPETDQRGEDLAEQALVALKRALVLLKEKRFQPTPKQKAALETLAKEVALLIAPSMKVF